MFERRGVLTSGQVRWSQLVLTPMRGRKSAFVEIFGQRGGFHRERDVRRRVIPILKDDVELFPSMTADFLWRGGYRGWWDAGSSLLWQSCLSLKSGVYPLSEPHWMTCILNRRCKML